jgi:quinol monooxygenase YgiN
MIAVAVLVALEAKAGKEEDVASLLRSAVPLVQQEAQTIVWFALRLGPSRFAIFDAFPDEAARDAHLAGQVAATLIEHAPDLLAEPPSIENVDVLAHKMPS